MEHERGERRADGAEPGAEPVAHGVANGRVDRLEHERLHRERRLAEQRRRAAHRDPDSAPRTTRRGRAVGRRTRRLPERSVRPSGRPAGGRRALRVGPRGVEPDSMSERGEDERAELTNDDVATALKVLARVAADRTLLAEVDAGTRTTLQRLAGEVARPDLKQRKKLQRALLRNERLARRARDEALRKGTGIQQLRDAPVFATPLPQLPPAGTDASGWWPRLGPSIGHSPAEDRTCGSDEGPELSEPRKCYVCKAPYGRLHPFYDQLCRPCGDENFARRGATVDLRGRVALVTGARVKIGYQAAILLLRAGCSVVACTRFPRDAARALRARAGLHGLDGPAHDLRHRPAPHAERRAPLPARSTRTLAAPRLPAPQRLPDRAPTARLLRPPPRARAGTGARRGRRRACARARLRGAAGGARGPPQGRGRRRARRSSRRPRATWT